jgi:hypothetical protein
VVTTASAEATAEAAAAAAAAAALCDARCEPGHGVREAKRGAGQRSRRLEGCETPVALLSSIRPGLVAPFVRNSTRKSKRAS